MEKSHSLCLCLAALAFLGMGTFLQAETRPATTFTLSSPAFTDGGTLPIEFTGDGKGASPPLASPIPPQEPVFLP